MKNPERGSSATRTLALPEVPWLMPSWFIFRQVSITSWRRARSLAGIMAGCPSSILRMAILEQLRRNGKRRPAAPVLHAGP
jgi:hypothetical protein